MIKLIECPRDAMQGIHDFIPTEVKARYIQSLLRVGFDTLDFGSFVSPKAIPQMRDTAQVLEQLVLDEAASKLLAIIANYRGAEDAVKFAEIQYLGFPLSASETFQQRNTNKSIQEALEVLAKIQDLCKKNNKTLVTYLSMGFGNPYGDPYSPEIVEEFSQKLVDMDIQIIALADTVGAADSASIQTLFNTLIPRFPQVEFGAHFHARPESIAEKLGAAYQAGCRRFDSALLGFGGCPMAKDDLVGNIATEGLKAFFQNQGEDLQVDEEKFGEALQAAHEVFSQYS